MSEYKNWSLMVDANKILWVFFDKSNSSVNTIDPQVMEEFSKIIDTVQQDYDSKGDYKGLVIASKKEKGFIAGANISEFTKLKNIDESISMLKTGQGIFDKLEALKIPTVAMIDGFCLGGGLELALACKWRVVEDGQKTRLGFPEVKLGIIPGWGGSVRMLRLIGPLPGLNMVLSGHTINGRAAYKLGLADAVVPKRELVRAAIYYILNQTNRPQPSRHHTWMNKKFARQIIAYFLRKKIKNKVNPLHYPAPFHAIDNWEHVGIDTSLAFDREARACGRLFFSDTSQNLVRVFFLQEKLKNTVKNSGVKLQHIHIIGAGKMGGDIAAWCALQGLTVTLQDLEPNFIAPAIKRAHKLYTEKLKEPRLVQQAMDRLIPDLTGNGLSRADLIIEAIVENLEAKQSLFKLIELKAKKTAILATNTSSIPLDDINTVLIQPSRLVGIHFFNPVDKMQLVEVVKGEKTSLEVTEKAMQFVRQIDRLPLQVKSSPGFLVNRILMPYLLESVLLLDEGVPASAIDEAMIAFGMPMGPIALADAVGLDVCLSVANYLGQYFNTPVPPRLIELVEKKKLGKKTGSGFYQYRVNGQLIMPNEAPYHLPLKTISERLVLRMLNEAFACLREGVVLDADLLDAAMIFGTGFAPFRGGPIHYAESEGVGELFQQYIKQQLAKGKNPDAITAWETNSVTMD